jgi:hypothetical protein
LVVEPRPGQGQAARVRHRVHHHVLIDALQRSVWLGGCGSTTSVSWVQRYGQSFVTKNGVTAVRCTAA